MPASADDNKMPGHHSRRRTRPRVIGRRRDVHLSLAYMPTRRARRDRRPPADALAEGRACTRVHATSKALGEGRALQATRGESCSRGTRAVRGDRAVRRRMWRVVSCPAVVVRPVGRRPEASSCTAIGPSTGLTPRISCGARINDDWRAKRAIRNLRAPSAASACWTAPPRALVPVVPASVSSGVTA